MIVKLLTEHHLEFLSFKGGCRGSFESTHVKMPIVGNHMHWLNHNFPRFKRGPNIFSRGVGCPTFSGGGGGGGGGGGKGNPIAYSL